MTDSKIQKKLIKNLKDLEKLLVLAKKHKIPHLRIEDIEVTFPKDPGPVEKNITRTPAEQLEDLLFNDGSVQ